LLLALILTACSNSGREPLLEQDGTLAGVDSSDSGNSPADVVESNDITPTEVTPDGLVVPVDVTAIDLAEPDHIAPMDVVGPKDTAPLELVTEDIIPEIVPVDIVPPGPTCGDIFMCGIGKGCGLTSDICWETCFGKASESELQTYMDLSDCVALMCEELPPEEQGDCLMSQCITEVLSCLGGGGEAGCLDTFTCIQGCGPDDGICYFECVEEASEESLELLLDMSNATENESLALIIECVGGQGEMSCGETVGCFTSCEDNPPPPDDPDEDPAMDCMMTCIADSSPEGADDLLAFLDCAEEACPDGMDACPGVFVCLGECPGLEF